MKKIGNRSSGVKGKELLCIIVTIAFVCAITTRINAYSFGSDLGASAGTAAGRAIGSIEGLTKGRDAGKTAGLSAEDTDAEIANELQNVEKLEVLVASVKLSDFHTVGKENNPNYAALYLVNGTIVFTVDMGQAKVYSKEGDLHIQLTEPEGTLYIDNSSVDKVGEYQRKFFDGSAEDGFDAYLNTMTKVQTVTEETLGNYNSLRESAVEAAENQVSLLVQSVSNKTVVVEWKKKDA